MKKIGLLSDTHNHWDEKFETHFASCDEIWHAGDIGSLALAQRFETLKPFRAVYGNIDDAVVRRAYPHTSRSLQSRRPAAITSKSSETVYCRALPYS